MTILFLLLSSFTYAQTVELAPVLVQDSKSPYSTSRSVDWPMVVESPQQSINLPQLDDALNTVNGLQTRVQGSPSFSIRGSAQSGRALILYNNIPLNFASGFAPEIFIPKESLGQVVMVKGPASLFYGSQAMAGSIDFISKEYKRPEVVFNLSDTDESFLPWKEGKPAHNSLQLAAPIVQNNQTFIQTSLFTENDDGQFPYQLENQSGVRQFNNQTTTRWTLNGSTRTNNFKLGFDAIAGKQIRYSPGSLSFPTDTRQETDGALLSVTPHVFFNDQQSLKTRVSYLDSRSEFLESGNRTYNNLNTLILQNEWIYEINPLNKLQVFADGFFHNLDSSFAGDSLTQDNFEWGPFLNFKSLSFLKHQVGFRHLVTYERILPTLSTHFLVGRSDLWISYSEGFRNPTLTDLYSKSPIFIGNANLSPELSKQWEVGAMSKFGKHWSMDVRAFHMDYLNFVETYQISPSVFSKANRGEGYSRGFDLATHFQSGGFTLDLAYNFLDTLNKEANRPFRLSPKHQLSWSTSWTQRSWKVEAQNTHWYDTYDVSGNQAVRLKDWQQWNFYFHKQLSEANQVSVGIINAFNEAKELTIGYPEPQRKFWLRVRHQF